MKKKCIKEYYIDKIDLINLSAFTVKAFHKAFMNGDCERYSTPKDSYTTIVI